MVVLHYIKMMFITICFPKCYMPLGSKLTPPQGSQFYIEFYKKNFKRLLLWTANGNLTKFNRNGPQVHPYQNCSNGSDWLHKLVTGSQNAIFKNIFVWNLQAQSFHIWYITLSKGPLPKLLKICPWGQNWPRPGDHNFTLNYIRKMSNDFFSWATLMGIGPNSTGMIPGPGLK